MACLDMQNWKASEWNDSPVAKKCRETRWLKWSSSIRRYSMNELGSSRASSRTILYNLSISCLLAIQPLTQTRRFLLLMRAFSSPCNSINARTLKLSFAKRRHFGLRDVNIIAWELGTADQVLHVMLHKMLRPCSHVGWWMLDAVLRAMLHRVSGPLDTLCQFSHAMFLTKFFVGYSQGTLVVTVPEGIIYMNFYLKSCLWQIIHVKLTQHFILLFSRRKR